MKPTKNNPAETKSIQTSKLPKYTRPVVVRLNGHSDRGYAADPACSPTGSAALFGCSSGFGVGQ